VSDRPVLEDLLAAASVDDAVFALRPDYRAMLVAAGGINRGPSDTASGALLQAADAAEDALARGPVERLPDVAA
jgi:hypothetical protein